MIYSFSGGGFTTCIGYWLKMQEIQLEENIRLIHEASPTLKAEYISRKNNKEEENDIQVRAPVSSQFKYVL